MADDYKLVSKFPSLLVVHVGVSMMPPTLNLRRGEVPFYFNQGKLHINYTTKIILFDFENIKPNEKIMGLIYFL